MFLIKIFQRRKFKLDFKWVLLKEKGQHLIEVQCKYKKYKNFPTFAKYECVYPCTIQYLYKRGDFFRVRWFAICSHFIIITLHFVFWHFVYWLFISQSPSVLIFIIERPQRGKNSLNIHYVTFRLQEKLIKANFHFLFFMAQFCIRIHTKYCF